MPTATTKRNINKMRDKALHNKMNLIIIKAHKRECCVVVSVAACVLLRVVVGVCGCVYFVACGAATAHPNF